MGRIIFKLTILLLPLSFINNQCKALNVPGYIINERFDTIYGTIKLNKFSEVTGGVIINGFDQESLHYKVLFKSNTDKSFQTYYPGTIQGFGFSYKSSDYSFKNFLLEYKSIFKKERLKNRFLYLVYKGKIDLYKDVLYVNNSANDPLNDKYTSSYQYFLYNSSSKALFRVAVSEQIKTMRDLLKQVNVNDKFIQEIPEDIKFKDIQTVLEKYDAWLLKPSNEG